MMPAVWLARSARRLPAIAPLMGATMLLLVAPPLALAAPNLVISPAKVARGQWVTMTGSGYQAGAIVRIVVTNGHERDRVTTLKANATGRIRFAFHVGPGADAGTDEFLAIGRDGKELAQARLTVTNAPPVGPQASVSPTTAPVGTRLTLRGSRFPHHVTLLFGIKTAHGPMLLGRTVTTANGTFTTRFNSSSFSPGKYELAIATSPASEPLALLYFTLTRAQH